MTDVVWVCSPPTVATAKGSGNPTIWLADWKREDRMIIDVRKTSRLYNPSAAITVSSDRVSFNHGHIIISI